MMKSKLSAANLHPNFSFNLLKEKNYMMIKLKNFIEVNLENKKTLLSLIKRLTQNSG